MNSCLCFDFHLQNGSGSPAAFQPILLPLFSYQCHSLPLLSQPFFFTQSLAFPPNFSHSSSTLRILSPVAICSEFLVICFMASLLSDLRSLFDRAARITCACAGAACSSNVSSVSKLPDAIASAIASSTDVSPDGSM